MLSVHYDEHAECWTVTTARGTTTHATKQEAEIAADIESMRSGLDVTEQKATA